MATRRKYKPRIDHAAVDDDMPAMAAPASPAAGEPTQPSEDGNPLQRALEAVRHAEDLQHQHAMRHHAGVPEPAIDPATRQAIDAQIDGMGLSPHKARFLKSHPTLLTEPYVGLMRHSYQLALHAGVADDTPAMDQAIVTGVLRDLEHHRQLSQLSSPNARPTPENHQANYDADQAAADLAREAETILAEQAPPPEPPAMTAPRRSFPVSPPVSRDIATTGSGQRPPSQITLNPDERDVAAVSFPHLPKDQAELSYARNKARMIQMKRDGMIQGDR